MIKKKVFAVIMYVLACCTVLSACTFATKEETEQSSEKKAKKKPKILQVRINQVIVKNLRISL